MSKYHFIQRWWNKCKRIRYVKGFGVHSPFAFNLITWVINEKYPYYEYKRLGEQRKLLLKDKLHSETKKGFNSCRTDLLLFRLVNHMQPSRIVEMGTGVDLSMLYMRAAKKIAESHLSINKEELIKYVGLIDNLDFVLLNDKKPQAELWNELIKKAHKKSLFIITGINDSLEMQIWWKEIVANEQSGITFDLYELGLVFFDYTKMKQHYIVNF